MSDIVPDPKTVAKRYGPGVWLDKDDQLHIDPSPILRELGLPDTIENQEIVIEQAKALFRSQLPENPIIDLFDKPC